MKPEVLLGEVKGPHGRLPREVELATMNGDQSSGEMVLGYLDSVLDRDVARSSGLLRGKFPASGFELDESELPKGVERSRLIALPPTLEFVLEKDARASWLIARG